jgi:hypothetical protein
LTRTIVVVTRLDFIVSIFSSLVVEIENSPSMRSKVSEIQEVGVDRQVGNEE